jgi:hypothetical protein
VGRTYSFRGEAGNVWNRRYLVVAARSGEGPFTDPSLTHCSRIANQLLC